MDVIVFLMASVPFEMFGHRPKMSIGTRTPLLANTNPGLPESQACYHTDCTRTDLDEIRMTALDDVDGGFAIAWWNAPHQELRLIRDRFGAEPLFYARADGTLGAAAPTNRIAIVA